MSPSKSINQPVLTNILPKRNYRIFSVIFLISSIFSSNRLLQTKSTLEESAFQTPQKRHCLDSENSNSKKLFEFTQEKRENSPLQQNSEESNLEKTNELEKNFSIFKETFKNLIVAINSWDNNKPLIAFGIEILRDSLKKIKKYLDIEDEAEKNSFNNQIKNLDKLFSEKLEHMLSNPCTEDLIPKLTERNLNEDNRHGFSYILFNALRELLVNSIFQIQKDKLLDTKTISRPYYSKITNEIKEELKKFDDNDFLLWSFEILSTIKINRYARTGKFDNLFKEKEKINSLENYIFKILLGKEKGICVKKYKKYQVKIQNLLTTFCSNIKSQGYISKFDKMKLNIKNNNLMENNAKFLKNNIGYEKKKEFLGKLEKELREFNENEKEKNKKFIKDVFKYFESFIQNKVDEAINKKTKESYAIFITPKSILNK